MRRFLPRAVLSAALALSAAACAAGTATSGSADAGAEGGRYQVLIPNLQVQGGVSPKEGERVAGQLRNLVSDMATHTAVPAGMIDRAKKQYNVAELDAVTSRQLAQQIGAQLAAWGVVEQGGAGLQADVQFVDTRSGDQIEVENASGANANELAQAIFASFQQKVEGIRQAAFCNDYLSSQQFDRALETCQNALAIVPKSTAALYGKATALLNLKRYDESLQTYQQLLELDPAHQDALLGAGLAASQLTQSEQAMAFYNRYLELNPGNVQVRMTVANEIAKTGDYLSAYRVLEPAVDAEENRENPEFQRYLFSLATAAGQKVKEQQDEATARPFFETALRAYEQAFAADTAKPDLSTLRQVIAVNSALGRTQQALSLAREMTTQYDTVASAWSQYASALTDAGQHAEAVRALTRVAQLDPEFENVYIRRAMANLEVGNRQQALADLERAAQRGNRANVAQVLYREGANALRANRFDEAVNMLEQAHGYADSNLKSDISFFWGYSLYKQGEAIAKANTQGNVARARQALNFFQRALPIVQRSNHASASQVISATQQYIENQEAIIKSGSR